MVLPVEAAAKAEPLVAAKGKAAATVEAAATAAGLHRAVAIAVGRTAAAAAKGAELRTPLHVLVWEHRN